MLVIGEEELGDDIGDIIQCPHCDKAHVIEYGKTENEKGVWVESRLLACYKCGEKTYLAGINGKSIKW